MNSLTSAWRYPSTSLHPLPNQLNLSGVKEKAQERIISATAAWWRIHCLIQTARDSEAEVWIKKLEAEYADQGISRTAMDLREHLRSAKEARQP